MHNRMFSTLDGLRGVAALLIAIRHSRDIVGNLTFSESYLAVDLFFLLSGIVIANAYEQGLKQGMSLRTFAIIRAARFYPLYLVSIALVLVYGLIADRSALEIIYRLTFSLVFLPNPLDMGLLFPINAPAWSLFFEAVVNAFYARTLRWLEGRKLVLFILAMAIAMMVCVAVYDRHSLDQGWAVRNIYAGFFRVGFSFFTGIYLHRLYTQRLAVAGSRQQGTLVPLGIVAIATLIMTATISKPLTPYFDCICVMLVFPALVYTALWFDPDKLTDAVFRISGKASYAMYILHMPTAILTAWVLKRTVTGFDAGQPVYGLLYIPAFILACVALDRYLDQPARRAILKAFGINRPAT